MTRLIALILSGVALGSAADLYFDLASAGANNGTSCANARAYSSMAAGDWVAGNTLHVCGTGTAGTNATPITSQGSGSAGNPVTVLFESGAVLQAQYCSSNGCIRLTHNYITVDGGSNGIIRNTANGTARANQQPSNLISSTGANITIQNLTLAQTYVYTDPSDGSAAINSTGGIVLTGARDVLITRNTLSDMYAGVFVNGQATDANITISNNTISATNWGIACGQCRVSGFLVDGNDISAASFDDTPGNYHHNGVFIFNDSGQTVSNLVVSNNYIHDINGHETGHIFLDPSGTGNMPNAQIYNNVLTGGAPTNAFITIGIGVSGSLVAHNTISGTGAQGISGQVSPTWKNNIVTGMGVGAWLNTGFSGVASDYNLWYGLTGNGSGIMCANNGGACYESVAAWTAARSLDSHSVTGDPNLSESFTLQAGSAAIGVAENLSGLGIAGLLTGAPQTFGVGRACGTGCVVRSTSWDIGAHQYSPGYSTRQTGGTQSGGQQ